jgi:hypothetical protein
MDMIFPGSSMRLFHASQQWVAMFSWDVNTVLERRFSSRWSLPDQVQDEFPRSRNPAVLEHVEPLISAKHHSPAANGNAKLRLSERALDVRWHVVRAFGGVAVEVQFLRNEFLEEGLEIALYV